MCQECLCRAETANFNFFLNFENLGSLPNILKMDRKVMGVPVVQFLGCIESRTVRSGFACNIFTLFGVTRRLRQAAEILHDLQVSAFEFSRNHLLLLYL